MNERADGGDERLRILLPALNSPSPLNIQPWYITFPAPKRIDLFIDTERILPRLDPSCHQILLSFGAFIENLDIAAREDGFRSDVTFFPAGWPGEMLELDKPVARIDLTPDDRVTKDPLFAAIPQRQSNRRAFRSQPIPDSLFGRLTSAFDHPQIPMAMGYTIHPGLMNDIIVFLIKGMEIELADNERFGEIASWISFGSPSLRNFDGLKLSQLGMTGLSGWFTHLALCLSREQRRASFMKHALVSQTRKQATSAAAFGWIVTPENHRITQIRAGRAYERVHLTAALLGLSLQPMNHVLHTYNDMEKTRRDFQAILDIPETSTPQMFFRIGYARPAPSAPRRPIESVIR
jgi:hypothetical protein